MAQEKIQHVQQELLKVVDNLDRSHLRKLQAETYLCASKCCQNPQDSKEAVDDCVARCRANLEQAEQIVQQQLTTFQSRLQRCVLGCGEDYRDRMMMKPNEAEGNKYNKQYESCISTCIDSNMVQVPKMVERIVQLLNQNAWDRQFS